MSWVDTILYNIKHKEFYSDYDADKLGESLKTYIDSSEPIGAEGISKTFYSVLGGSLSFSVGVSTSNLSSSSTLKINYDISITDEMGNVIKTRSLSTKGAQSTYGYFSFPVKPLRKYTIKITMDNATYYGTPTVGKVTLYGTIVDKIERYIL